MPRPQRRSQRRPQREPRCRRAHRPRRSAARAFAAGAASASPRSACSSSCSRVLTSVEVVSGRPLSDLLRGKSGSGTTVFGVVQQPASSHTPTPTGPVTVTQTVVPKVVTTTPTVTQTAPAVTVTPTPPHHRTPTATPDADADAPTPSTTGPRGRPDSRTLVAMCGIVGYVGPSPGARRRRRGPAPPGVPRLRLGRRGDHRRPGGAAGRQEGRPDREPGQGTVRAARSPAPPAWGTPGGPRTARRTTATPTRTWTPPAGSPSCTTASSRTSPSCAPNSNAPASNCAATPTPRPSRTSSPRRSRAGAHACRRGARRRPPAAGRVHARPARRRAPRRRRRRAAQLAARRRRRRRRDVPRQRRRRVHRVHPRRGRTRAGPGRRDPPRRLHDHRLRRLAAATGRPFHIDWDLAAAEKGGYDYFMLKEIQEQPDAVRDTLLGHLVDGHIVLDEQRLDHQELRDIDKVFVVACGTAYHAGLIGKQAIEHWTRIPVEVEMASEFRYRDPVLDRQTLVVAISQSGETADTLEAVRHARDQQAKVLAICNTNGAQIPRESDAVLYTHAGPEIGVAATKTFLAQVAAVAARRAGAGAGARHQVRRRDPRASTRRCVGCRTRSRARCAVAEQVRRARPRHRRLEGGAVHRPPRRLPGRAGGRAQAQGARLHARRGLPGRRAQARPDRADRAGAAGRRDHAVADRAPAAAPEDAEQRRRDQGARRAHDRDRRGGRRDGPRATPTT